LHFTPVSGSIRDEGRVKRTLPLNPVATGHPGSCLFKLEFYPPVLKTNSFIFIFATMITIIKLLCI